MNTMERETMERLLKAENTMTRLIDIEITSYGTIFAELEIICCITGFRQHLLVKHLSDGSYHVANLGLV
jgi:ADP-glucose pyrophosphorylase